MSDWRLLPDTPAAAARAFASLDAVFAMQGDLVTSDPMSYVARIRIDGVLYYIKCYFGLGKKPLRRLLAKPRVQLEWENLQHFADWGIPTARLIGYGLESRGGRFVRGALITAEIPHTTDLGHIARTGDPRLKSRRWWDGISKQLAEAARRMHDRRFAHGDFKWRNLLIDDADRLHLIDCPSGGFWWPPFLEYRIVKDLACLDKLGKRHLSRTQRLRFYLDYARKPTLDSRDKRRIRNILGFFSGRDEDIAPVAELRAAGRAPVAPVTLQMQNDRLLNVTRWLRILPGKRLTGLAHWQGQPVLAKLFIATRGSARHWQRERDGAAALTAHGVPTPALLAAGSLATEGHYVLYEYLDHARHPDPDAPSDLAPVFAQVGRMHALGLLQQDLHLDNFLFVGQDLYVIDGDAIRTAASAPDCLRNLALLFAQLPPANESALRPALLDAYQSGNPQASIDEARLADDIAQARAARLTDYLDKCLRDCSLFKVRKRADYFYSVQRQETDFLAQVIHDPDAWMEQGTALKQGRTATLARVEVGSRSIVIKRYNIKSAGHALSRCWRPSRAWHSWIEGHRLDFLGIPTPRPLALIERRLGPLRGKAWLITEYCPGEPVHPDTSPAALAGLFRQLAETRITHGDLKATNLLWREDTISFVDLDAMKHHDSDTSFARAWHKDRQRLLRNWPEDSAFRQQLDRLLPAL